ncbi:MAG TPA: glycosyl hydrolase family 28-related protein, partial [Bryobacteraceae bacterium]|nr:glycosyl hydrolase family 28-related protein [Bryobacteraceae bacterium]
FFKSDAPAGQNLYGCTAPNTWTLQSSGTSSGEANTASTIGGGTFHWFAQKLGVDLQFKSFDVSSPISVSESSNRLTFSCPTCIVSGAGYSDPSWITALAGSKIIGDISGSAGSFTGSLGGDVSGGQAATVVGRIQGRPVASTSPADGQSLVWSAAGNQWQPGTVSGSGGASSAADLNDFKVVKASGSLLTVNAGCSAVKPCVARFGNKSYAFTTSATVAITFGSGQAFLYLDPSGTIVIGHSGLTISCAGCVSQNGITQFPTDSLPLFIWSATAGSWDDTGADFRSFLSAKQVTAGTGVVVTEASGIAAVAVDTAVVPQYSTGAGAPSGSCTAGQSFYLDTTNHNAYYCTNTNTWEQIDAAGGTGSPGGTTGAVQFHDGAGFGGDATNFAWDNTNKHLTVLLRDKGGQVYNVKAYGAVGDYDTDDTAAIQAAIDAAATAPAAPAWANGGAIVFFPTGTYRITAPLTLKGGVTLQGVSSRAWSSVIHTWDNITALIQDQGLATETVSAGVRDLAIDGGNDASYGAYYGLHLRYCTNCVFDNVAITFTKSYAVNTVSGAHNKFNKVTATSCNQGMLFGQHKWQASKYVPTGTVVGPTTAHWVFWYEATTGGTTGVSEPTWPLVAGNTVNDGSVVWTARTSPLGAFTNSYIEDTYAYGIGYNFTVSGTTVTIAGVDYTPYLLNGTEQVFALLTGGTNNTLFHAIRTISNVQYSGGNTTFTIDSALDDRTGGASGFGSDVWIQGGADNLLFVRGGFGTYIVGNDFAHLDDWSPASGAAFHSVWVGGGGFFLNEQAYITGVHTDYDLTINDISGQAMWLSTFIDVGTRWGKTTFLAGGAGVPFSRLPSSNVSNGATTYCSDCTVATPCASGGTGAMATRLNGAWSCGGGGGSGAPTDAQYVGLAVNGTLTNERVLTPGMHMTLTDGGAGGNATMAFNPTDEDVFWMREEFYQATSSQWGNGAFGGATANSSYNANSQDANHWGVYRLEFAGSPANGWGASYRVGFNQLSIQDVMDSETWEYKCIVKPEGALTQVKHRCGLLASPDADAQLNSVYVEHVGAASAGVWRLATCDASTCSTADSAVTASTAFTQFRVWCSASSGGRCTEVSLSVNGGAAVTKTTNLPTSGTRTVPAVQVITTDTVNKYLGIDFWSLKTAVTR